MLKQAVAPGNFSTTKVPVSAASPPIPKARQATVRAALLSALEQERLTAKELSTRVGLAEKDVAHHLVHLSRTLAARGQKLEVTPASCIECGFTFRQRERLTRPGSCPDCDSTRIDPPMFQVVQR